MRRHLGRRYSIFAGLGAAAAVGCVGIEQGDYDSLRTTEQAVTATSRVLVNQIGYVSNLTKIASVTGSGCNAKAFYVKNGAATVFTGTTSAAVTDPGSGDVVCKADFSTFTTNGTFTLQVDGISTSDPFVIAATGADLYPQSLYENAVYYFTYHRLGTQNVSITLPGSTGTNKSRAWTARSNVSLSAYNGWTSGTFNIDGGHMDAGDFGVYADSAAHAMWSLMNLVELKNPNLTLTKLPDTTKDLVSEVIYGTKFMNGLLPADTTQLAAHKCHDVSWGTQPWGYTGGDEANRRCMGPSSTATYAVARSLAQLVRVAGTRLGANETTYWNRAKEAWTRVQGKDAQVFNPNNTAHSPGFAEGGGPYNDLSALDDKFAAAVELYLTQKARGETVTAAYLTTINSTATDCQSARCLGKVSRRYMDWEHDYTQGNLSLMAYHLKVGGTCTSTSCTGGISADVPSLHLIRNAITAEADSILSTIAANGFPTPIAGSDYPWGSNKVVAHSAMILGYAHHLTGTTSYLSGMHQSLDYLLGQNTLRLSFITGYGTRFETATHDRQANGNSPLGWLSGGPINAAEINDPVTPMNANPAKNYALNAADFGQAWCSRENTVDWNGPLSWVAWYVRNPTGGGGGGGGGTHTGEGTISVDTWNSVTGTTVANIPVGTTPSSSATFTSFEAPSAAGDNYGRRVRGYLMAPATGSYTFWIAGDDNVQLYLSTNTDPATKQLIASHTGWTASREWNKYTTQKSAVISLTAGQEYYIEALQKEGTGGDNLAVGWLKPGQTGTVPSEVIPGTQLSPFGGGGSCTPGTCSSAGAQCGSVSDGCGGTLSCGSCTSGNTCNASNQCVASCTPATCSSLGAQCGSVSDGCGGTLSCGSCTSGNTCNASNQCVASGGGSEPCTPQATVTGGQSGNFNTTGAYCFRTLETVNGWGCSNFTGRTVAVNSTAMSCGGMPMPTKHNGYYYFNASAGSLAYASIYWW